MAILRQPIYEVGRGSALSSNYVEVSADVNLQTNEVIETFKRMSEQMVGGHEITGRQGPHSSLDSDKLLRILCHRNDQVASKFLKKQYKLSSTWSWTS